jgi:hypothetical protein
VSAVLSIVKQTKICSTCKNSLPISEFSLNNNAKDKLQYHCKKCDKERQSKRYKENKEQTSKYAIEYREKNKNNLKWRMKGLLNASRQRAAIKGRENTLTKEFLISIYPKDGKCPIFGFDLEWNRAGFRETSPSIDRIDSSKGYTEDNVQIISWKANRIKSYATIEELEMIVNYLKAGY